MKVKSLRFDKGVGASAGNLDADGENTPCDVMILARHIAKLGEFENLPTCSEAYL